MNCHRFNRKLTNKYSNQFKKLFNCLRGNTVITLMLLYKDVNGYLCNTLQRILHKYATFCISKKIKYTSAPQPIN